MRRCNAHEITLIAFAHDDETGARSIMDIVETSYRNASLFTRRWMRDPAVTAISASSPNAGLAAIQPRDIRA